MIVQITRNQSATTILRVRLTNTVRAAMVFVMGSILMIGGIYQLMLKAMLDTTLTPRESMVMASALVVSYLSGMLVLWLMNQVQVEVPVDVT